MPTYKKGFWSACSSLYLEEEEYEGSGGDAYPGHRGGYEEEQSVQQQQMAQPQGLSTWLDAG
jgi:hypothetical protein